MDPESRLVVTLFMWISGLGGAGGIGYAVVDGLRSRRAAAWPSTNGRVVESEVRVSRERSQGVGDFKDRRSALGHMRYEYHVAGRRYLGHRVRWVDVRVGSDHAQQLVSAYPVGRAVTVYYDPANPQSAVLEQGAAVAGSCSLIAGGLFFLAIAVVMRVIRGP